MFGPSRSRRFRPVFDALPQRLTPSSATTPMDPCLVGWTPPAPTPPPAVVTPLDPTLVGWTPAPKS